MRAPLVIPALLVLDAIVVARDFPLRDALALGVVAACTSLVRPSPARRLACAAVAAGLALGAWHAAPNQLEREVSRAVVRGTVASDVTMQHWGDAFELLGDDGRRYAVTLREAVAVGEHLTLLGRLEPFDEPRNPGEPSARDFARERGLFARLTEAKVLARAPATGLDLRTIPARIRALASVALHRALDEPDATILAGMLYGARGSLPADLRAEFQDTGTIHVLVTAGLHLGIVASLLTFLLGRAGIPRVPAALASIPIVWAYAVVSGAHVPSLRAATMVTVALVARALGERAISLNTLALAAVAVAAIWPAWVGEASFGLSFSCVGAIVLFAGGISRALERCRIPQPLREALALTLSTQIGVWPLTASTFLVIAPYAALANLFVVPVVGVALTLGLVLLAVSPVAPLASVAGRIVAWPLCWIESVVHLTATLPHAHVVATPPPGWALATYDAALIAAAALLHANAGINTK